MRGTATGGRAEAGPGQVSGVEVSGAEVSGADLRWERACRVERLQSERGVAALLGSEGSPAEAVQVAIFRTHDGRVFAVGNLDPISGAAVLSRGIVGDRGGVPTVASPIYKQSFDLRSGTCLDRPGTSVPSYPTRVTDGWLEVGIP